MDQGLHLADARYKKLRADIASLFGLTSKTIGTFVVAMGELPESNPVDSLCCLANDNTTGMNQADAPTVPTDLLHVFTFPAACTLTRVELHGKAATIGSVNELAVAGTPVPLPFDLYVNQVFVQTLVTLPASATDVDLVATPNVAIPAGAEVQFVCPEPGAATGNVENFLFSFSIG
jgi:hypothetical protein